MDSKKCFTFVPKLAPLRLRHLCFWASPVGRWHPLVTWEVVWCSVASVGPDITGSLVWLRSCQHPCQHAASVIVDNRAVFMPRPEPFQLTRCACWILKTQAHGASACIPHRCWFLSLLATSGPDGPSTWVPAILTVGREDRWSSWLQALFYPQCTGHCSQLRNEPAGGRSLCHFLSLCNSDFEVNKEILKKKYTYTFEKKTTWALLNLCEFLAQFIPLLKKLFT